MAYEIRLGTESARSDANGYRRRAAGGLLVAVGGRGLRLFWARDLAARSITYSNGRAIALLLCQLPHTKFV